MKCLLDTHTLIWHFEADPQLPLRLRDIIDNSAHEVYVSTVSLWEMTIKVNLGKLTLTKSLEHIFQHVTNVKFSLLPTITHHLLMLEKLPLHHRDPFDRLLIATAMTENLTLISADHHFQAYEGLTLLWE